MKPIVVIAGLSVELHDRVRMERANAFAPNGQLIVKPLPRDGFNHSYAQSLIKEAFNYAFDLPESEPISFSMCYVSNGADVSSFLQNFFPFALVKEIDAIDTSHFMKKQQRNSAVTTYIELLKKEARTLINTAKIVKTKTSTRNLTPLLLPVRNFKSENLQTMLQELFNSLGSSPNPNDLLSKAASEFLRLHPKVTPPDSEQSCFTDGTLHFKSPGKNRHGFYRPKKGDGHRAECLLNARCRLGGSYSYDFHYDCTPIRGRLSSHYPNCHDAPSSPKERHVNISPNDFVIGS